MSRRGIRCGAVGNWNWREKENPCTDYRNYCLSPAEWLRYGAAGVAAAAVTARLFYRSWIVFAVLAVLMAIGLPLALRPSLAAGRRRKLAAQFRDGAEAVAAALSVGYAVENAWSEAAEEMEIVYGREGMITQEFRGICRKLTLNQTSEEAVLDLAERSGLEEIRQFAQVFAAAKRSSGELAPILKDTADVLGKKIQVQEEITTMAAAKRLEFAVMCLMPAGILVYINLGNPGFTDPLYAGAAGRMIMTICLGLYIFAIWLGMKLLSVEV